MLAVLGVCGLACASGLSLFENQQFGDAIEPLQRELAQNPGSPDLLYALAANLGQTVPTETLLIRGWADTEDADPSYVWVTMRRLRQKVEVDPNKPVHLLTVRGIGYRLVSAAQTAET